MPQWKENKSVICSFFLFSTKACIQAWSLTLFTRLRLCQKLKAFSWGQVMISKDTQSSCQSYPYTGCFRVSIHISKLYCLLSFQSQGREESTPQMLNWSRLVFDWSWVHKDQGSEGHFYHFTYAGSTSPLRLLWLWDLYINTSLWEGCGHLKLLPIIWRSTVLLWTPATQLRASNATILGIEGEDLGVLL